MFMAMRIPVRDAAYWTVMTAGYEPAREADRFLRHLRFGRGGAESTTEAYSRDLAGFLTWKGDSSWITAARELDRFVATMALESIGRGKGKGGRRSPQRVNRALVAVRELYRHGVGEGSIPVQAMAALWEVSDDSYLPSHLQRDGAAPAYVVRPRHRLRTTAQSQPASATPAEVAALLAAAEVARDRYLVGLMSFTGLRVGAALCLRKEHQHFLDDSQSLGCEVNGPHLHVEPATRDRRTSTKGAKYWVPVPSQLLALYEDYLIERDTVVAAAKSAYVLVNVRGRPVGEPMTYANVREILARLSRRARLERTVTPHMLRHGLGAALTAEGVPLQTIQMVLGHRSPRSTAIYARPDERQLRAAVERAAKRSFLIGSAGS
jgi:site-specific recombinase XerD